MEDRRCVIDTNLLVYSTVKDNPWHDQSRRWLTALQDKGNRLCITTQILREYLVVLTRGAVFETAFSPEDALQTLKRFLPSMGVLGQPEHSVPILIDLISRYQVRGKHIHDANVVAVMLTHKILQLVTFNQKDFECFKEISLEPIPSSFDS